MRETMKTALPLPRPVYNSRPYAIIILTLIRRDFRGNGERYRAANVIQNNGFPLMRSVEATI